MTIKISKSAVADALNGDGRYGRATVLTIFAVILLTFALFSLRTVETIERQYEILLDVVEIAISVFFLVEYSARIWTAPDRIRYVFSFWGFVDLIAIVPLLALFGINDPSLKILRLLRLAQIFKIARLGNAHRHLLGAFFQVRNELFVFFVLEITIVLFASVGIYLFEHQAQPDTFGSVPASIWWAVVTLTTVGYGDAYPITFAGRAFTVVILLVGLAVVAVPAGLFSAALISAKMDREAGGQDQ